MKRSARKFGSVLIAVSAVTAPALVAMPASPAVASAVPMVTGTVPNMFFRNCSRITWRCTAYRQTNPPYDPRFPSAYYTNWVWSWV